MRPTVSGHENRPDGVPGRGAARISGNGGSDVGGFPDGDIGLNDLDHRLLRRPRSRPDAKALAQILYEGRDPDDETTVTGDAAAIDQFRSAFSLPEPATLS